MNKNWVVTALISSMIFFLFPPLTASTQELPINFTGSIQSDPDPSKNSIAVGMFADAGHGATCALPAYAPSDYLNDMVVDMVGCNVVIEGWLRWANRGGGVGTININRANVDVQGMYRLCDSGRTYGITNITDSVLKCKGLLIGDGGAEVGAVPLSSAFYQ